MLDSNEGTGGNDIDVETLISQSTQEAPERPMGDEPEPTQAAPPQPAQAQAQAIQELELELASNKIKVPIGDPRLKQWAQQGYDYGQRMQLFKQEQQKFQQTMQETQGRLKPYEEIDAYAKQNPQWWEHVKQTYEQRATALNGQDPIAQELMALKQELQGIKEFKTNLETEKITQQHQAEDKQLSEEMESIRKTFSDLDFASKDADGKSLEYKVLDFAHQNGIRNYSVAFKAFNHDQLTKLAAEKAREAMVKESQANKKSGLLGKTPAPTKGISDAKDIRGKNYNDLLKEALEELGLN